MKSTDPIILVCLGIVPQLVAQHDIELTDVVFGFGDFHSTFELIALAYGERGFQIEDRLFPMC